MCLHANLKGWIKGHLFAQTLVCTAQQSWYEFWPIQVSSRKKTNRKVNFVDTKLSKKP